MSRFTDLTLQQACQGPNEHSRHAAAEEMTKLTLRLAKRWSNEFRTARISYRGCGCVVFACEHKPGQGRLIVYLLADT